MSIKIIRITRFLEIILIFIGLPLLFKFNFIPIHKLIPLLIVFLICLFLLLIDKSFERKKFGFTSFSGWRVLFIRFFIIACLSIILVWLFRPESLFIIVRRNPLLWVLILIFYPIFSAFPQELIYRSFFFHRYKIILKNKMLFIFINALLFSFSHIIFNNWLAIILTFFISFLFAYTYKKSNSLLVVSLEHALYGNLIFTVGIGDFFYLSL